MTAAVLVQNLHKVYNNVHVVNDVSLTIQTGESFGLLGPNGAGKSTTIRMLTTLTTPTDGQLVVAGHDVQRQATEVRRDIGVVLQQTSVDGDLSAWENMEFHGRMHHIPAAQRQRDIERWIGYVGLGDRTQEVAVLNNLGRAAAFNEDFDTALNAYEQALVIFQALERPVQEAHLCVNIGQAHRNAGRPNAEIDAFRQVVSLSEGIRQQQASEALPLRLEAAYRELAALLQQLDRTSEAQQVLGLI